MLSPEQTAQIKEKIINQINSSFPEDKKPGAKSQIEAMNSEQLEEFLKQNNIMKEQQCVFCSIISGDVNSYILEKEKDAIAILEINPISQGHVLIVPKKHSQEFSPQTKRFARKISKLLKEKLKPKDILISQSSLFGHGIINIIPVYKDETNESERHKANPEELERILKKILEKIKKPIKKPKVKKIKEKLWLPKRIP